MKSKFYESIVFIVEDDQFFAEMIKERLLSMGYKNVKVYNSGKECIVNLDLLPKVVILDFLLQDYSGDFVLEEIKQQSPDSIVVMMSAQRSIEVAIKTMKNGVSDYIVKNHMAFSNLEKTMDNIREREEGAQKAAKKETKKANNPFLRFKF